MATNHSWAGIPAAAYRSTAPMEAVKHYMERAAEVFGKRDETISHRQQFILRKRIAAMVF
jgi:hypothetical protein